MRLVLTFTGREHKSRGGLQSHLNTLRTSNASKDDDCLKILRNRNGHQTMSGTGFNGINAFCSRALTDFKAPGEWFRKRVLWLYR